MFPLLEDIYRFSTYTMRKKTQYSVVSLEVLDGIPVAAKKYHTHVNFERYEIERDILIELNGKWRTPRLLACNDKTKTLYIEWIAGDRLKEYVIQRYLGLNDIESYSRAETITKAFKLFKTDQSSTAMKIKTQIFSIVRLLHRYGVVHGDLDHRNFVITPEGFAYILDFSNGEFPQPDSNLYKKDINTLENKFAIHWRFFEWHNASYLREKRHQCCTYPNGLISLGDGQGSTYRKFRHLGIKNLKGFSFLDIGCSEGEICRYACRKGAKEVFGLDVDNDALRRGREVNSLWGYHSISLKKGDVCNLVKSTGGKKYDVVVCLALLHHIVPDGRKRDILGLVTHQEEAKDRKLLIDIINEILSVTNLVLFLELPFNYVGASTRSLETGRRFCEAVAPDIKGSIRSLGIWHANAYKARFVFRIDKPEFSLDTVERILLSDPVLDAWHRNIPVVLVNRSTSRAPPPERTRLIMCASHYYRRIYSKLLRR